MVVYLLQFWTLKYVDPATYQILGNLKIVTTGVLFRLLLQRRLSLLQWISLVLLMIGATTSQVTTAVGNLPILLQAVVLLLLLWCTMADAATEKSQTGMCLLMQLKTSTGSEGGSVFAAPIEVGKLSATAPARHALASSCTPLAAAQLLAGLSVWAFKCNAISTGSSVH